MPVLTPRLRGLASLVAVLVVVAAATALTDRWGWSLAMLAVLLGAVLLLGMDIRHRQQVGARDLRRLQELLQALEQREESRTHGLTELRAAIGEGTDRLAGLADVVRAEVDTAEERHRETTHRLGRLDYEPVNEVQALLQLLPRVADAPALPGVGGWALSAVTLLQLWDLVQLHRPTTVVECGSGSSTLWLAYAVKQAGAGRVLALDHSRRYAEETRALLARHGLDTVAEVRHAPLEPVVVDGEERRWYRSAELAEVEQIDLLVVDGPPKATGPMARYPAVPLLRERLVPGALVVLDDAYRPDEQEAVERWSARYGLEVERRLSRDAALLRCP